MELQQMKKLLQVAGGKEDADLVLKNGQIIDVYQGRIISGDIAVSDGIIAGVGASYSGKKEVDVTGKFVAPGLIEPHIHVESSYVTPEEFGRILVLHGTTTAFADPHEIANVFGIPGIDYMVEASSGTKLDLQYTLPSCVPCSELDESGAVIDAEQVDSYLDKGTMAGLAEFMDYNAVANCNEDALKKILSAKSHGLRIDGHAPGVAGKNLCAYSGAGIANDHECTTIEEMEERITNGMYVFLREGTATKNLKTLLPGVNENNMRRIALCADDIQAKTILEEGHLDNSLRICVKEGLTPVQAIRLATLNAAESCDLKDRGAIAPGLKADFAVFDDLDDFAISQVFISGEMIVKNGKYLPEVKRTSGDAFKNSIRIAPVTADTFSLKLKTSKVRAIEVIPGEIITNEAIIDAVLDENGEFQFSPSADVAKIAVIERHKASGRHSVGLLKNYGIKHGAIAISIAHDSHNLVIVGTNDADMLTATEWLKQIGGGAVLAKDGKVLKDFPLPIAGLMSEAAAEEVTRQQQAFDQCAYEELGISREIDPIMLLSFMCLSVIPQIRITDKGVLDVRAMAFRDVEV